MADSVTEAFLLCGGDSERLGFPKEMLRVDGVPLAVAMVRRLRGAFQDVAVVTNHPEWLEHWLDVHLHTDAYPGLGPLAGIHAGLQQAVGERAFFMACDMPLVSPEAISALLSAAGGSAAPAVVASANGRPQPLCGVYSRDLLPALEERLEGGNDLSATRFLREVDAETVELERGLPGSLRDIDRPADVSLLRRVFSDVAPLPVRRLPVRRVPDDGRTHDLVVEESSYSLYVSGVHLLNILCLPVALRELSVGFLAYLGLATHPPDPETINVDYEGERILVNLDVATERLQRAVRLQLSSSCGAEVFGPPLPELAEPEPEDGFRVPAGHITQTMHSLRARAPVFDRTGATHQAALTDGERVVHFEEDVGRHNAIDKVIGHCLLRGTDTRASVLLTTGRLNAQAVVKALRGRVPVLASRSAPTARAVELARERGLTLVGFARGRRLNAYTRADRILPE
ncbi:MAG: formate dehydrogenase accessory sulfurtransferase FdhD [Candidatus Brocadiia bacterium]